MTKSNVTRKSALSAAIIAFDFLNMESIRPEGMPDVDYMEVKETLAKMLEQVSKPRAKAVSKARKANEYLASVIVKQMPVDGLTSKEIVAIGLPDVATTQKAAAVMRVAEELGLVVKVKDGKKISYKPVTDDDDVEGE
jgi:CHAT domain-containing protein